MAGRALAAAAVLANCFALCAPARAGPILGSRSGLLHSRGLPVLGAHLRADLARAQHWRGTRFLGWLPGGAMLVATHAPGRSVLQRLATPGGTAVRLVSPAAPVPGALVPRVGERFLYAQRSIRDVRWFVGGRGAAQHALLANQSVIGRPVWSAGGRRIAFLSPAPDGDREAVYITRADGRGLPRLVVGGLAGRWRLCDWSHSTRHVLLKYEAGPDEQFLYTASVANGALRRLPVPAARILSARFAPGGGAIDFISNQGGQYEQLLSLDPASRTVQRLSTGAPWDVEQFAASPNGHYIAYTLDDDGHSVLHVINRPLRLDVAVPWLRGGVIGDLQFDSGHRLGLTFQSGRQPPSVYVYNTRSGLMRRWTAASPGEFAAPASARLIHFPTWDRVDGRQRMLSAYVYLPPGPGPVPVLVVLHAGAAGQFRPRWRPFLQFVANDLGYAVIAPNVRGSSGYGRQFRELADGVRRTDAVRDIGALMVWIGLQPGFDAHRIVVMGRGYGGWLAVNALAMFDGHLLGAIDIDGIANLADYVARAPQSQRQFRAARFGDPQDPQTDEFLRRISPIGNTQRIVRPVLIVQGLAGHAVRSANARQLAYLLRFHGDRVVLLTTADAGSRFTPPAEQRVYRSEVARFLLALKTKRAK